MKHPEHEQQKYLMQWAAYVPELKWLQPSFSAGRRTLAQQRIAKEAGLKAGVSDVFLPKACGNYHGLWIELKVKPNRPTKEQLEYIQDMITEGYYACVCYSWIEAKTIILKYLEGKL